MESGSTAPRILILGITSVRLSITHISHEVHIDFHHFCFKKGSNFQYSYLRKSRKSFYSLKPICVSSNENQDQLSMKSHEKDTWEARTRNWDTPDILHYFVFSLRISTSY
jgi:hypothetical protein